jgi:hypothetical protein
MKPFLSPLITLIIAIGLFAPLFHTDAMGHPYLDVSPIGQNIWLISFLLTVLWVLAEPATRQQSLLYKIIGTLALTVLFTRWVVGLTVWLLLQNSWLTALSVPLILGSISCCIPRGRRAETV